MSSAAKPELTSKPKSKSSRTKQSASGNTPRLKVVVRRLPPNLPENIFWQSVAQWVTDESSSWKLYVPGKLRTKLNRENTPSRAYVEFTSPEAVVIFNRDYNGHVFRDKQGNESVAVVEYAPYQKVPHEKRKADTKIGTIEADEDFVSFLEALNKPAEPTADVSELVIQATTAAAEPTSTPLLDALKAAKEANTIKGYHSHYRDQPAQSRHRTQDLEDAETFNRKAPLKNQQDPNSSETKETDKGKDREKDRDGGGKRGKNKQKDKAPAAAGPKSPKPSSAVPQQPPTPSRAESSRVRPPAAAAAGMNARVLAALGSGAPPGRKGGKQPPSAPLPAGIIAIPVAVKPSETPKKPRGGRNRGRGGGAPAKESGSAATGLGDMPRIDDPGQALSPVATTQRGRGEGGGGGSGRGRSGRGRGRGRGGGKGAGRGSGEPSPSPGQT
ncbi:Regulator of nonsense transcripts UPF3 [Rhizoctonia solani]|uniref:Regulator of nonsense transcripts UPF3 n=1 Tax=Rhizoctonia solani TaxID=456999 RepID=A0A0K6G8W0_9AGAM|nr:Regulator of nonsense transcripts UPF3 [Rhizoctonia solani]